MTKRLSSLVATTTSSPSFSMNHSTLPTLVFVIDLFVGSAFAAPLQLTNDPSTGEPGKFAAAEIQRAADANGIEANIALTVDTKPKRGSADTSPPRLAARSISPSSTPAGM